MLVPLFIRVARPTSDGPALQHKHILARNVLAHVTGLLIAIVLCTGSMCDRAWFCSMAAGTLLQQRSMTSSVFE